jgi:hypothetical protein
LAEITAGGSSEDERTAWTGASQISGWNNKKEMEMKKMEAKQMEDGGAIGAVAAIAAEIGRNTRHKRIGRIRRLRPRRGAWAIPVEFNSGADGRSADGQVQRSAGERIAPGNGRPADVVDYAAWKAWRRESPFSRKPDPVSASGDVSTPIRTTQSWVNQAKMPGKCHYSRFSSKHERRSEKRKMRKIFLRSQKAGKRPSAVQVVRRDCRLYRRVLNSGGTARRSP